MQPTEILRFREGVRFFDFEESSFVIDISTQSLYNLGRSSALIAANINGKNDISKVMQVIMEHYDVSREDSANAVIRFLAMMQERGLVEKIA
jgi:hypothetical protein